MSAVVIKLKQRKDPAFRAMAMQLLTVYFRDGDEAFLSSYQRLDRNGPQFSQRLAWAVHALIDEVLAIDEAESPR